MTAIDQQAAGVERGIGAVDADKRRQAVHVRILQDHIGQLLLPVDHRGERNRRCGLGRALQDAGILQREDALGDEHV